MSICEERLILIKIYQANKSLMVNTYVDKVFKEIDDELKKSKNIIKKETFKNIKYILDDLKEKYKKEEEAK